MGTARARAAASTPIRRRRNRAWWCVGRLTFGLDRLQLPLHLPRQRVLGAARDARGDAPRAGANGFGMRRDDIRGHVLLRARLGLKRAPRASSRRARHPSRSIRSRPRGTSPCGAGRGDARVNCAPLADAGGTFSRRVRDGNGGRGHLFPDWSLIRLAILRNAPGYFGPTLRISVMCEMRHDCDISWWAANLHLQQRDEIALGGKTLAPLPLEGRPSSNPRRRDASGYRAESARPRSFRTLAETRAGASHRLATRARRSSLRISHRQLRLRYPRWIAKTLHST